MVRPKLSKPLCNFGWPLKAKDLLRVVPWLLQHTSGKSEPLHLDKESGQSRSLSLLPEVFHLPRNNLGVYITQNLRTI